LVRTGRNTDRAGGAATRLAAADAVSIYWHFMDALWIYLFLLLFLWR
jgi:heme/copper-type cytochrome/quinol oxidase subunit 3